MTMNTKRTRLCSKCSYIVQIVPNEYLVLDARYLFPRRQGRNPQMNHVQLQTYSSQSSTLYPCGGRSGSKWEIYADNCHKTLILINVLSIASFYKIRSTALQLQAVKRRVNLLYKCTMTWNILKYSNCRWSQKVTTVKIVKGITTKGAF